ncbi:MAG: hypothetical protein PHX60_13440 [Giesbergeria sp.]|nr:hypothetical protein [Giesbergeria sp.]
MLSGYFSQIGTIKVSHHSPLYLRPAAHRSADINALSSKPLHHPAQHTLRHVIGPIHAKAQPCGA